ncbi:hypothetical protein [Paracoccus sp. (in: a-proteobacteria)]|uniref:hypothetical protein n=1 Tax=Paracoccus sp. TaxID=267 RepID=UPI00322077E4
MIGVILWSSPAREKAVIWCEDHGALAYMQGCESLAFPANWPQAGDLVELEVEEIDDLRHARQVALVSGGARSELPVLLREIGDRPRCGPPVLRVIANDGPQRPEQPPRLAAAI